MRRVVVPLIAVVLGATTTLGLAFGALVWADQATASSSTVVVRHGTEAWIVREHATFGLTWVNCERATPPLVNAVPTIMDIPQWAIPPERTWPIEGTPRVATLAVGWPAPFVTRQWSTTSHTQIFPLQIDLDDGRDSLRRAAGRFREDDPALPRTILWRGAAIDVGLLSFAWAALLWTLSAVLPALLNRQERQDSAHQDQ